MGAVLWSTVLHAVLHIVQALQPLHNPNWHYRCLIKALECPKRLKYQCYQAKEEVAYIAPPNTASRDL